MKLECLLTFKIYFENTWHVSPYTLVHLIKPWYDTYYLHIQWMWAIPNGNSLSNRNGTRHTKMYIFTVLNTVLKHFTITIAPSD